MTAPAMTAPAMTAPAMRAQRSRPSGDRPNHDGPSDDGADVGRWRVGRREPTAGFARAVPPGALGGKAPKVVFVPDRLAHEVRGCGASGCRMNRTNGGCG